MRWSRISRRKFFSLSSLRTQGPIRRGPRKGHADRDLLTQSTTVVMGPRFRGDDSLRDLRPETLRRTRDRDAAAGRDFHDSETAFVGAVGAKAKQAVDAGKARRVGQRFRRKALR